MSMVPKVIAECVDVRTGKRHYPGEVFPDPDENQLERLRGAGCISMVAKSTVSPAALKAASAGREEAEAEIAAINREVESARGRRDEALRAFGDELNEARIRRDEGIKAFEDEVKAAREAADAEIARIGEEVAKMREPQTNDPAATARQQINEDGLFEKTVEDLRDVAKQEGVDLGDARKKDEIVAAIRAARAAKVA